MKFNRFAAVLSLLFGMALFTNAQQQGRRLQYTLNDNWKFKAGGIEFAMLEKSNDQSWQRVSLPHTWNAVDPFDDDATYQRGICWYRKKININADLLKKEVYLYFEGANQVADVYLNGAFVGQHKGGYTAFSFDVTPYLKPGENLVAIQVNNAQDNFIPPLSVGYAMYGGIYRDLWLVATDKVHFDMADHAANGIFISTPQVSATNATVKVKGTVVNDGDTPKTLEVVNQIYDQQHQLKASLPSAITIPSHQRKSFELNSDQITKPQLWSPENPNLYSVVSRVIENGKILDEVSNPLGFRWFSFDPNSGFILNGKKYVLHGTNRHQDLKEKGSALSNEDHDRDLRIIKNMGANFVRLAHYPQAAEVLRMADQLGLIVWEEIPVVNNMNVAPEFLENGENMLREMIRQHYNHPSAMIWGSMNEVLLWSKGSERIQEHTDTAYVNGVRNYARKLDSTVRAEDPSRYSTMAMHWSDDYDKFKLSNISQIAGWNIYNGWYSGKTADFAQLITQKHQQHPNQVMFISEYGAESDNRINAVQPMRLDFSGQYQRYYHEAYLEQINRLPFLAGTAIWNEFDFSQPNVGGTMSHMNHKGMVTWDRQPKDVYYLYKANWNPEPMVYIASRDWQYQSHRAGALSTIDVYANTTNVSLSVNGKNFGSKRVSSIKKASWQIALQDGDNELVATANVNGKTITDHLIIHNQVTGDQIDFSKRNTFFVNVGSVAQYTDGDKNIWIEDQPYKAGSFGYIGGTPAMLNIKTLITYTDDTPLFYTYQDNIKQYKADVPEGAYEVELCFIEPDRSKPGNRVFDVSINDVSVIKDFDLAAEAGCGVAVKKKFLINVTSAKGLEAAFKATKGNPVLSGIKIKKI